MSSALAARFSFEEVNKLNELLTIMKLLRRYFSFYLGVGYFSIFYSSFIALFQIGMLNSFM